MTEMGKKKTAQNTYVQQNNVDELLCLAQDTGARQVKNIKDENKSLAKALKKHSLNKKSKSDVLLDLDGFSYREIKKLSDDKKLLSLAKGKDLGSEFKKSISEAKMNRKKEETLDDDRLYASASSDVIEACPIEKVPVVTATVISSARTEDDETLLKDLSHRIAKDFVARERLLVIDEKPFIYNGRFYVPMKERDLQKKIYDRYYMEINQKNPLGIVTNAAKLVDFNIQTELDEFPVNSNLIVFENGTLEIDSEYFRSNSADDFASSALGIDYDPKCWQMPETERFLKTIADGDEELYRLMLQVIGYILSNDIKAKSFFYLEGVGDAGKSRFCDLIASFFPKAGANKVARIPLQDLDGKFALANLVNAKLNISEDLPNKPLSEVTVGKIKMLSDSNRQEAEAKYVQRFSFRPTCKFLFASNHPLKIKEYDQAFMNRIVYIPFLKAIPKEKQDRNILEKMQKELPALFNHAFEAYKQLVASGYAWAGAEKFRPKIEIIKSGTVIDKISGLKEFFNQYFTLQEDSIISVEELKVKYYAFCDTTIGYSHS